MNRRWRVLVADLVGLALTITLVVFATARDWGGCLVIVVGALVAAAYVLLALVPMLAWRQQISGSRRRK